MLKTEPDVTRILVVEDHPLTVAGIRSEVTKLANFEIVAEAQTVSSAITTLGRLSPAPDITIVDLWLARERGSLHGSGFELIRWITAHQIPTKVIILTMYGAPAYVLEAAELQVAGFVTKGSGLESIRAALKVVRAGGRYISSDAAALLFEELGARARGVSLDPYRVVLSDRERQLVQFVGRGMDLKGAAKEMHITSRTATQFRASAMRRVKLSTYEEFVLWAGKQVDTLLGNR